MNIDRQNIIQLRKELNWTQEDLAAASGLSARTIQRVERSGKASLDTVKALAIAFDVTANELMMPQGELQISPPTSAQSVPVKQPLIFWFIAFICVMVGFVPTLFIGGTLVSTFFPYVPDMLKVLTPIILGLIGLTLLFLSPVFLMLSGLCLAVKKFSLGQKYILASFAALFSFGVGAPFYLEEAITLRSIQSRIEYFIFYLVAFLCFELFKRQSTSKQIA